jgi:hypothetical protein
VSILGLAKLPAPKAEDLALALPLRRKKGLLALVGALLLGPAPGAFARGGPVWSAAGVVLGQPVGWEIRDALREPPCRSFPLQALGEELQSLQAFRIVDGAIATRLAASIGEVVAGPALEVEGSRRKVEFAYLPAAGKAAKPYPLRPEGRAAAENLHLVMKLGGGVARVQEAKIEPAVRDRADEGGEFSLPLPEAEAKTSSVSESAPAGALDRVQD